MEKENVVEPAKQAYPRKKVFISYSWSSKAWVNALAKELVNNGIDVAVDFWDLQKGDDMYVYMEKEVNDKSIDKVLIVCDKQYKEKANNRQGGVGTETQILTPEIYKRTSPRKYIPILKELDENQQACIPTFLSSKFYLDFSNPQKHAEMFEELVNVIYDQTVIEKPMLGPVPEKILNHEANDYPLRRAATLINSYVDTPHRLANLFENEFISELLKLVKQCDITKEWHSKEEIYQMVMDKLASFDSVEEKFKECVRLYIRSGEADIAYLAEYFSKVNEFIDKPHNPEERFDAIKFILLEQFLIVCGELIKQRQWDKLKYLVEIKYKSSNYKVNFEALNKPSMSIYDHNSSLKQPFLSPEGELLSQRNKSDNNQLWSADILLFYIGRLRFHRDDSVSRTWIPKIQIGDVWVPVPDFPLLDNLDMSENMNILLSLTGLSKEELEAAKEYNEFTRFGNFTGVPALSEYDSNKMY
ncbi:TIR domain-containing protein [Lactobacillus sp. LC28-10]|uniref:TIR domain-containing protein n=1 Tax=Secundilactobacillus angelensis TaxID=2722706 RepID=A0ABX1KU76_9LACO|nr:SEFIR domain-containing protein [Secundilactobacillus angelensis]MCH5461318.1 TIR domain-containing protein [Secundilactobacillus angelensis]NLR17486.1 TIR domain-containing protein [Secundilactobacillus angelensis]